MSEAFDEELRQPLPRPSDEQDLPPRLPSLADVLGKWGTRGFVAGAAVGFAFIPLGNLILGESGQFNSRMALAIAMLTGIVAVCGALAGLAVGFGVGLFRRLRGGPHGCCSSRPRPNGANRKSPL